ncbi:hypothetical protein GCM10011511_52830 [Puia dinghuensis]|uniref:Uncharacterized protein n=2 Tax=Puia dinghuensis TaxID=1792502 RepID=A0A8J2XWA7_9BACT|nr:hypothetical protein GCM10011511_52830 [Puia dinghuensis]
MVLAPCFASSQNDYHPAAYTYNDGRTAITSNVPLNEINARAYRHFQRIFPAGISNEYWFVSDQGYQVSFLLRGRHFQAYFDKRGGFRYSLQYYAGREIPRVPGDLIRAKYPDYQIDVVTEITDGEKTFHLVKIVNPTHIITLSVVDGKIEVLEELINDTAVAEGSPLAPGTPLVTRQSYP